MQNVWENWTTIEQEHLLESINFTPEEITELLLDMGLVRENECCHIEDMEKYIFLYGNEHETYGLEECSFIECVGTVYIYNDFNRKTNKGTIATKIYAVDLCQFEDGVRSCFFFMKLINKACDKFNVFFFKTTNGLFLGCRLYDKDESKNCVLSEKIKDEVDYNGMIERLSYLPESNLFIPFYSAVVEAIEYKAIPVIDYDLKVALKRGVNLSYLNMLSEMANTYNISVDREIERYYNTFEPKDDLYRNNEYMDGIEELKFIKSNRSNTLELLFEAEEMLKIANQIEEKNDKVKKNVIENYASEEIDYGKIKQYLSDPEQMIKLLKEQRGI